MSPWSDTNCSDSTNSKKLVLISPSLHTGLDLKDEQSRFQIIVKIPYPSKADIPKGQAALYLGNNKFG
jgi:Rad3-related DNA helicase